MSVHVLACASVCAALCTCACVSCLNIVEIGLW